jgi:hypothetical protein
MRMSALSEHYAGKECPGDNDRWRVVENKYSFTIECGRARPHITIVYGDTEANIPIYGTKDQAKADAQAMTDALNRRDNAQDWNIKDMKPFKPHQNCNCLMCLAERT